MVLKEDKIAAAPSHTLKAGVRRFAKKSSYVKQAVQKLAEKPTKENSYNPTKEEIKEAFFVEKKDKKGALKLVRAYKYPNKYTPAKPCVQEKKKTVCRITKLKKTLTPGTVIIILKGTYAGKRCVFLKQMPSGMILIAGPFGINGVPVRRFQQAFVLGTSTKIDISNVTYPEIMTDELFGKEKVKAKKVNGVFEKVVKQTEFKPTGEKLAAIQAVDAMVVEAVKAHPEAALLKKYLVTKFSLVNGMHPHRMQF